MTLGLGPAIRLGGLAVPVVAGLIAMATTGAPHSYLLLNAGALALALLIAAIPLRISDRARTIAIVAILVSLALVALAGPPADGVRRWIALGPLHLHAGMLLGPALVLLTGDLAPNRRTAAFASALTVAFAQPDLAFAMALAGALVASARGLRDAALATAIGAAGVIATMLRADPLAPVRHVEGVIADAWSTSAPGGAALLLAQIAPVTALAFGRDKDRAQAAFWTGLILASLLGPWPAPLIGAGAAPILGYGLFLALRRGLPCAPAAS